MIRPLVLAAVVATGLAATAAPPAAAQVPVDTALVLAVDASGSIDAGEFALQKEGIAQAVTAPEIVGAIRAQPLQRTAFAYVEWGGPRMVATVVAWMIVSDVPSARAFADAVLAAPRSPQSYNAIGDAIDHAAALIAACPCQPTRRVIDISGDNRDNRSLRPAPIARDAAVAAGITVNALAIIEDARLGPAGRPWLAEYYERDVIGGPGAFVEVAQRREDFTQALRRKMIREIAAAPSVRYAAGR